MKIGDIVEFRNSVQFAVVVVVVVIAKTARQKEKKDEQETITTCHPLYRVLLRTIYVEIWRQSFQPNTHASLALSLIDHLSRFIVAVINHTRGLHTFSNVFILFLVQSAGATIKNSIRISVLTSTRTHICTQHFFFHLLCCSLNAGLSLCLCVWFSNHLQLIFIKFKAMRYLRVYEISTKAFVATVECAWSDTQE